MPNAIPNDPRDRQTFDFEEDPWHVGMNENLTDTVGQVNKAQRLLLGDAAPSSLEGYSGDALVSRVGDLETTVDGLTGSDGTIASMQDTIGTKADRSAVQDAFESISIATADGTNTSGETLLSLSSATSAPLDGGERLVIHDLSSGSSEEVLVDGSHSSGVTEITLSSGLVSGTSGGELVLLDPTAMADVADLSALNLVVGGSHGVQSLADKINNGNATDHHTLLQEHGSRIDSVESDVNAATRAAQQALSTLTDLETGLTSVQTTAEEAAIAANDVTTAGEAVFELSRQYGTSGQDESVDTLEVSNWTGAGPDTGLSGGERLAIITEVTADPILVKVAAGGASPGDTTIQLDRYYNVQAAEGAKVYFTAESAVAKVSARTNGQVVVDGKLMKSQTFNGAVQKGSDNLYHIALDGNGNALTGDQGWALTSGGQFVATEVFIRGGVDIQKGRIDGPTFMGPQGSIENEDGSFRIDPTGVDVLAYDLTTTDENNRTRDKAYTVTAIGSEGERHTVSSLWAGKDGNKQATHLRASAVGGTALMDIASSGDTRIAANGSDSGSVGELRLDAAALKLDTSLPFLTDAPTASGPQDLVDKVNAANASDGLKDAADYFSDDTISEMNGLLWVDASDGYRLKRFHPDMLDNTVSQPSVNIDVKFTAQTTRRDLVVREVEVTETTSVNNGQITDRSWAKDMSVASPFGSTSKTSKTETFSYGDSDGDTVEIGYKVFVMGEDGQQYTEQVTKEVDISKPEIDIEPPTLPTDPEQPPYDPPSEPVDPPRLPDWDRHRDPILRAR